MKKKLTYSPWVLPLVFTVSALVMTLYEGGKELLFQGSLTPWQSHSITIIFTALLATLSASIMRAMVLSVLAKEKELEARAQSLISFGLVVSAVDHIVNNVLNYFQLIKLDIEIEGKVQEESLKLLDENIKEAQNQMKILNKIQNPADPDSYKEIYPPKNTP